MFSTILEMDSPTVPTIQAGGNSEKRRIARLLEFEPALTVDDLADVGGVALTAAGDDLLADGVELAAEVLDVRGW